MGRPRAACSDLLVEALVPGGTRFEKLLAVKHSVFVIQVILHFPDRQTAHITRGQTTRGALGKACSSGRAFCHLRDLAWGAWGLRCSLPHSSPLRPEGRPGGPSPQPLVPPK